MSYSKSKDLYEALDHQSSFKQQESIGYQQSQSELFQQSRFDDHELKRSVSIDKRTPSEHNIGETQEKIQENFEPLLQIKVKAVNSILPIVIPKVLTFKRQITISCFANEKKITLRKQQIDSIIQERQQSTKDRLSVFCCSSLISKIVGSYCQTHLNFQPCQINEGSFELIAVTDKKQQILLNDSPVEQIYAFDNITLFRKKRDISKLDHFKSIFPQDKNQFEVIEILVPDERQIIETIDKTKNGFDLREKLAAYQPFDRIVVVYYNSFKLIEFKKKIGDMTQKTFEIFRQKVPEHKDRTFTKKINQIKAVTNEYVIKPVHIDSKVEVQVKQYLFYGKLMLRIQDTKIIDIYRGGMLGYLFSPQRMKIRSIHTLVALKIKGHILQMEHIYANREQIVTYQFAPILADENIKVAMMQLVRLSRVYNKNFLIIS